MNKKGLSAAIVTILLAVAGIAIAGIAIGFARGAALQVNETGSAILNKTIETILET